MKLYSDGNLTLTDVARAVSLPAYVYDVTPLGRTRVRRYGWNLKLGNTRSNRRFNTGTHGSSYDSGAATWDDWGRVLSALFDIDPLMRAGYYDGRNDFHRKTNFKYLAA